MRITLTVSVSGEINDKLNAMSKTMGTTKSGAVNYLIRLGFIQYERIEKAVKNNVESK